jgi:ubiquinone/menaquinone biosynthesis C-methylase UbiE
MCTKIVSSEGVTQGLNQGETMVVRVFAVLAVLALTSGLILQSRLKSRRPHSATSLRVAQNSRLEQGQKIASVLGKALQYTMSKPVRLQYATATAARFGYFLGQGVSLSLIGIDKNAKETQNNLDAASVIGALSDAILANNDDDAAAVAAASNKEIESSVAAKVVLDSDEQRALFDKNFQSIVNVLRADLANIEAGAYKFPYDLNLNLPAESNNLIRTRQWNPLAVLSQAASYVQDRRSVIERRDRKDGLEMRRKNKYQDSKYPEYYLQNFHYQSDGWLSAESARLYDYQVESLFIGTADAMRRQVLPHFTSYIKSLKGRALLPPPRVLDVATGTGRFASFVMDNFRSLDLDVLDLSPFYLAEAKRLLKQYDTVTYVEAPAEDVPAAAGTYDAITCVYLFHELPREVRKAVLGEWMRILKPGGKVFFVDSAQEGEVAYVFCPVVLPSFLVCDVSLSLLSIYCSPRIL